MRPERHAAIQLRRKGKSYGEIAGVLKVPKATLSTWLSQIRFSDRVRKRIFARTREKSIAGLIQRNKNLPNLAAERALAIRRKAAVEMEALTKRNLLLTGALLYLVSGYKRPVVRNGREVTSHSVSLACADPALARLFVRFLRECGGIPFDRVKAHLRIPPNQNEQLLLERWHKETKIPMENFSRPRITLSRSSAGKRPFKRLEHGVIQIYVASTPLYHRIMGYIEGLKKFV